MAQDNITYDDKVTSNPQPSIPEINKVTGANMTEIKTVVNDNATDVTTQLGLLDSRVTTNTDDNITQQAEIVIIQDEILDIEANKLDKVLTANESIDGGNTYSFNLSNLLSLLAISDGTVQFTSFNGDVVYSSLNGNATLSSASGDATISALAGRIVFSSTGITFTDARTGVDQKGLEDDADYSANYSPLSHTNKTYVDTKASRISFDTEVNDFTPISKANNKYVNVDKATDVTVTFDTGAFENDGDVVFFEQISAGRILYASGTATITAAPSLSLVSGGVGSIQAVIRKSVGVYILTGTTE